MLPNISDNNFHRVHNSIKDENDRRVITQAQEIPDYYLDWIAEQRYKSRFEKSGDNVLVASIPCIFATKWLREGFDVFTAPVKDIVRKLREENLEAFLATNNKV